MKKFKRDLCVVCSSGGHLSEAIIALEACGADRVLVTRFDAHVKQRAANCRLRYLVDPHNSLLKYSVNFIQAAFIFTLERPRVVFTTGSGIAIALCIIGKVYGSKVIYLESGARVLDLSRTGRLLYRFADLFYVQWEGLTQKYPKAIFAGRLI
jgi:UDP-N-acetylglucosamine:LPS N-acetylglucosamine transferase